MIKFFLRFILLICLILVTNRYDHDYSVLASSFHRGEVKFSLLIYLFQYIREYIEYNYIVVHLFYVMLFSWSLVKKFEPYLLVIIIVILPVGYILNEQIRFFSALSFGLVNPLFALLAFVIHPGASAIGLIYWLSMLFFGYQEQIQMSKKNIAFLLGLFALSPLLKVLAIKLASALGYGYVGSVFFESSSVAMKFFKITLLVTVVPLLRHMNSRVYFVLAITLALDSLAIVSGRTIIMFFILILFSSRLYSRTGFVVHPVLFSKGLFYSILIASFYIRFFSLINFG